MRKTIGNKEKTGNPLCVKDFRFGAVGGIRTLGRLMTATRFPVVLVMTSSIPLHTSRKVSSEYYNQHLPCCQDKLFKFLPRVRKRIHKRLSRVWKWEMMTIDSAEETEIS